MKEKITTLEVEKIASLARIHLSENENVQLTSTLERILEYVAKLDNLDVAQIEPTSHVLPLKNVYRKDIVQPSLGQEGALSTAVKQHNGTFQVPKVIE